MTRSTIFNVSMMRQMKTKLFATLAFVALMSFTAEAQRIAYVDVSQIMESIDEYKKAQDELDRIAATWRQEIDQEYDKIKGMYNRYQTEQVLLSDSERKDREDEIMESEKRVRQMQKSKFGPDGELFKKRQDLVEPIQDKVYGAIEEYANDKGFDFIFDKSGAAGIIFSNPRYDKTEDIIDMVK